jgi:DNA-binding CsgD family transcriptional regulator
MPGFLRSGISSPVLVGRSQETAALRTALAEARSGAGNVVLIEGQPGIGKSRLLDEVAATCDCIVVEGRCYEEDAAIPLAPLAGMLEAILALPDELATHDLVRARTAGLAVLLPDELQPGAAGLATDPQSNQRQVFEAMMGLLADIAMRRPVLVALEDLHWSGESTLAFVSFLARQVASHHIFVVGTCCLEDATAGLLSLLDQLRRRRLVQEIVLRPLSSADVYDLLRGIFATQQPIRPEFVDTVVRFSEGNPYYVEELLRTLVEYGDLCFDQATGVWERRDIAELRVPPSMREAVMQRAAQVSAPAREVLKIAAVVGKEFDFALLQALTDLDERDLVAALKELATAQLVFEHSADVFTFRHSLTREAVRETLLKREQRILHRLVAETVERTKREPADSLAATLAYHYYEGQNWRKAMTYAAEAGDRALALNATREALIQYNRAIDSAAHLDIEPPLDLLLRSAQVHETAGDFDRANSLLVMALKQALSSADLRGQWQAMLQLGFLWTARDYETSQTWFDRALGLAEDLDEPWALARNLNRIGNVHLNRDRPDRALPYHRRALPIFQELDDLSGQAETLELLAITHYNLADMLAGARFDEESLALARQIGDQRAAIHASIHLLLPARMETEVGPAVDVPRLEDLGQTALKTAREMDWLAGEAQALSLLGDLYGLWGRYDQALPMVHNALSLAVQAGQTAGMSASERVLGSILVDLLALDEAGDRLRRALALAYEAGAHMFGHIAALGLASACIAAGSSAALVEAEELVSAAQNAHPLPHSRYSRQAALVRAELELAQGRPADALHTIDRLLATTNHLELQGLQAVPRLALVRGNALLGLGLSGDAETELQAARRGAVQQSRLPLLWRIEISLGRAHMAQRHKPEASQSFQRALALIDELARSVPDPAIGRQFQQRASSGIPTLPKLTARQTAKQAYGGLTRRERSVAALVAQGKSNREIAGALVISERTVEHHVANILGKLGFTARTQIAVWAVEIGLPSPS